MPPLAVKKYVVKYFFLCHYNIMMAGVAQLVRALDCGSRGRRFDPDRSPQKRRADLAQLVEQLICNQ